MKERGILFQAPLVRAILAGNKTQTRRLMKPQPVRTLPNEQPLPSPCGDPWTIYRGKGWRWQKSKSWSAFVADEAGPNAFAQCLAGHSPYGVKGDRLWVRETWAPAYCSVSHEYGDACYFEWREEERGPLAKDAHGLTLHYRADGEDGLPAEFTMSSGSEIPWRPSIFMPRWASRVTLEITDVHVQRLMEITEEDARAEGVEVPNGLTAVAAFALLWNRVNGERASWSSNPWVWAITFRRLETP